MAAGTGCTRVLRGLALFLQSAAAMAIILITVFQLGKYTVNFDTSQWGQGGDAIVREQCLLGAGTLFGHTLSWCRWNYIFAGTACAAVLAASIVLCLSCDLCGAGAVLDLVLGAVGVAYWAVLGSKIDPYNRSLNALQPPAPKATLRQVVVCMYWSAAALCLVVFVFAFAELMLMARDARGCWGGRSGAARASNRPKGVDVEAPAVHVMVATPGVPTSKHANM